MKKDLFKNKTVIITGSSKGIGRTTALAFLQRGANVVINGRNPERLEVTRKTFEESGFDPLAIAGDATDFNFSKELVEKTIEKYGQIDYLINNAGLPMRGRFDELNESVFPEVTNSNLISACYFTKSALPYLRKTNGSVVFISSLAGIRGLPNSSIYCASKMALNGLAQSLKIEFSGTGVHVAIIEVGLTENDPDKLIIGKDGGLQPVKGGKHHTQMDVAKAIIHAIRRKKFRKTLTAAGKALRVAQWLVPGFVGFLLNKTQHTKLYD